MKKVFLVLTFSVSLNGYSQNKIKYISYYYIKTVDSTKVNYFKIGKEPFSFDQHENFYKKDSLVLKCAKDSFVTYEVYEDKFLIASYYPDSEAYLSFGPGFRTKGRFIIMSLKNPGKKWEFNFNYQFNTVSIINFDSNTNELFVKKRFVGKPKEP